MVAHAMYVSLQPLGYTIIRRRCRHIRIKRFLCWNYCSIQCFSFFTCNSTHTVLIFRITFVCAVFSAQTIITTVQYKIWITMYLNEKTEFQTIQTKQHQFRFHFEMFVVTFELIFTHHPQQVQRIFKLLLFKKYKVSTNELFWFENFGVCASRS